MALSLADIPKLLRKTSKGQLVYRRENDNLNAGWPHDCSCDERMTSIHPSCLRFQTEKKPELRSWKVNIDLDVNLDSSHEEQHSSLELKLSKLAEDINTKNLVAVQEQLKGYEEMEKEIVRKYYEQKRESFKNFNDKLYRNSALLLQSSNLLRTQDQYMKSSKLDAATHASQLEIEKKIAKLKNAHKSRAKESAERLEEAHQKDKLEAEEAQKKSLEIQQRYTEFTACGRRLFAAYQEIATIIKAQDGNRPLPDTVRHAVQSVSAIMIQYQKMVKQFNTRILEQNDLEVIQSLEKNTVRFLQVIKENIEANVNSVAPKPVDVQVSVKPAEVGEIIPRNTATNLNNVDTVKKGPISDVESLKKMNDYIELKTKADDLRDEIKNNKDLKDYRNDLQKYINLMINAISVNSGSYLLEKLHKLTQLLEGQNVSIGNRTVSVKSHSQGKHFCLDLIARKFVIQGETTISSSHVLAFPIATVAVGVWKGDSAFGELLLAHIYSKCPYLFPFCIPRLSDQTDNDYKIAMGYEVVDGALEAEHKFIERISGITRLFAAIIVSSLPRSDVASHPFAIHNAWTWLAKTVNSEPIPTITAAVLFDMLEVCGHTLLQTYGKQFNKLLVVLYRDYLARIKSVTFSGSHSYTERLEMFLQNSTRQGKIPPPKGFLTAEFWRS